MRTMIGMGVAALLLAVGLPLAADGHGQEQEREAGILVTAVDPDGPAADAGIERGDLILSIDGQEVAAGSDLTEVLAGTEESQVNLTVKHGDEVRDLMVSIERVWGRPRLGLVVLGSGGPRGDFDRRGMGMGMAIERMLMNLLSKEGRMSDEDWMSEEEWTSKEEWMSEMAMPGAKVMEVVEDSPAAAGGLQAGDWITAVDGEELEASSANLAEIIRGYEPGDSISVEYERDGEPMTATIDLGEHPETGNALLGVRFRAMPMMLDAEDMPELRRLFNWFQGRFHGGDGERGERGDREGFHRDGDRRGRAHRGDVPAPNQAL